MYDKDEIKKYIINRIHLKAGALNERFEDISDDFSLTGSGVFDSMDFMDLIANVETEFNVTVDFTKSDPEYFTTLKGFIDCTKSNS